MTQSHSSGSRHGSSNRRRKGSEAYAPAAADRRQPWRTAGRSVDGHLAALAPLAIGTAVDSRTASRTVHWSAALATSKYLYMTNVWHGAALIPKTA